MKNDQIPFARLRKLLLDLGFEEARIRGPYWRFRHAPSGTLFVYRDYKPEDSILWHDFASTRLHLDMNGLMEADEFEDRLHKTPV
jgi:hypothetical protein